MNRSIRPRTAAGSASAGDALSANSPSVRAPMYSTTARGSDLQLRDHRVRGSTLMSTSMWALVPGQTTIKFSPVASTTPACTGASRLALQSTLRVRCARSRVSPYIVSRFPSHQSTHFELVLPESCERHQPTGDRRYSRIPRSDQHRSETGRVESPLILKVSEREGARAGLPAYPFFKIF